MVFFVAAMAGMGAAMWTDSKTGYTWTYSVEGSGVKIYEARKRKTHAGLDGNAIFEFSTGKLGTGAFRRRSSRSSRSVCSAPFA